MIEIQKWLKSSRDYQQGLALFEQYVKNATWLSVFKRMGETALSRKQLADELSKFLAKQQPATVSATHYVHSTTKPSDSPDAPAAVKDAVSQRKQLYKQVNRLHERLVLSVEKPDDFTPEQRKEIAIEILNVWDVIDKCWAFTNHYDRTKEVLAMPKQITLTLKKGESLVARRYTLRTYLTPSYLNRIQTTKRAEFEQKTKAELSYIERLIEEQDDEYEETT